ncbi:MAG TPA: hypothetical protein VF920_01030, partial [Dongiaceae bacterium]
MLNIHAIETLSDHPSAALATAVPALLRPKVDTRPALRPIPAPATPSVGRAPQAAPLLRQNLVTGRIDVSIVLLPGFPIYDLAALCDTFAAANHQVERHVFTWRLISLDGKPVASSLGSLVTVAAGFDSQKQPDNILLLSGPDFAGTERLQAWLRQAVSRHAHVLGSGAAVGLMVKAGLLGGKA